MIVPILAIRICPGLGFVYQHDTWDQPDASVTIHNISLRAGAGLGFEQRVFGGFSVNPFVVTEYDFTLTALDFNPSGADSSNVQLTGDTLSRVQIEYGLIGQIPIVWWYCRASNRGSKGTRPYMARYILGVSFSGAGGGAKREESASLPPRGQRRPDEAAQYLAVTSALAEQA